MSTPSKPIKIVARRRLVIDGRTFERGAEIAQISPAEHIDVDRLANALQKGRAVPADQMPKEKPAEKQAAPTTDAKQGDQKQDEK